MEGGLPSYLQLYNYDRWLTNVVEIVTPQRNIHVTTRSCPPSPQVCYSEAGANNYMI